MPDKKTKTVSLFLIGTLMAVCCFIYLFRFQFLDMYVSSQYRNEISLVKKYLSVLSDGNKSEIRAISSDNANFLRPGNLYKFSTILQKFDIDTLSVFGIFIEENNGAIRLLADIYFEKDIDQGFSIVLIYHNNKWIMDHVAVSESLYKRYFK